MNVIRIHNTLSSDTSAAYFSPILYDFHENLVSFLHLTHINLLESKNKIPEFITFIIEPLLLSSKHKILIKMLPIFGFLLYVVAMLIASKVYQLRSSLHDVPLAIIGPSYLLLDTSMHPSPVPESANFSIAGDWLLLLGSLAFLITLVSLWAILVWVLVANPWVLDEIHDKCFISTVDIDGKILRILRRALNG